MMDNRYLKKRDMDMRRGVKGSGRRDRTDGHFSRYKAYLQRTVPEYRGEIGQEYYKNNPGIDFRYKDNDREYYNQRMARQKYEKNYGGGDMMDHRDYAGHYGYRGTPMYNPMASDFYDGRGGDYMDSRDYGDYRDYRDYNDGNDMNMDGGSEKKYHEDIKRWTEKLKRKDRFKIPKEEVISNAKQMGVKFEDFSEDEFYAVYLMMVSDYKAVANDFRSYLNMAKEWLEDDDIEVSPSEKLCIYFYEIVKGEGTN